MGKVANPARGVLDIKVLIRRKAINSSKDILGYLVTTEEINRLELCLEE